MTIKNYGIIWYMYKEMFPINKTMFIQTRKHVVCRYILNNSNLPNWTSDVSHWPSWNNQRTSPQKLVSVAKDTFGARLLMNQRNASYFSFALRKKKTFSHPDKFPLLLPIQPPNCQSFAITFFGPGVESKFLKWPFLSRGSVGRAFLVWIIDVPTIFYR